MRFFAFFILIIVAFGTAWFCDIGYAIKESDKISGYIGTIFSIMSASLFAVIAIVGDPSMLLPGNWRIAWNDAKEVHKKLVNFTWLFVLYITILALLVIVEVLDVKEFSSLHHLYNFIAALCIIAFSCSIWLPFEITKLQDTRLNAEIDARREKKI